MSGRKLVGGTLSLVSALILIIVILLTTIELNAFNLDFFRSEYRKLNSTQAIGISEQDLLRTTEVLLAYIRGQRHDLQIEAEIKGKMRPVFNQREIDHMADVQRLYTVGHWLRNSGLVLLIILLAGLRRLTGREFRRYWAGGFLAGTVAFICFLAAVVLAISRDFLWFWNKFHTLIFTNDLWLLNPETDILIQIVPEQFFFDLVVRILVFFTLAVVILVVPAGIIFIKKQKVWR